MLLIFECMHDRYCISIFWENRNVTSGIKLHIGSPQSFLNYAFNGLFQIYHINILAGDVIYVSYTKVWKKSAINVIFVINWIFKIGFNNELG